MMPTGVGMREGWGMQGSRGELDRRDVLKRAALVGGATIWVTPVIQSLSGSAWAATSGSTAVEGTKTGTKTPASQTEKSSPKVLGHQIPHTGSENVAELVTTGTGLVIAGAAAVAVAKRKRGSVAADGPPVAKHRRDSVSGDDA
jgi:LPXTG-motif cell wall-anchored protein